MIIGQMIGVILTIFPFSFIAFLLSERVLATHQSRVGMGEKFSTFFQQGFINLIELLRKPAGISSLLVAAIQLSFIAIIPFFVEDLEGYPLQGGFLVCLILNFMVLMAQGYQATYATRSEQLVSLRIQNDHQMIKVAIGSLLALICVFATFSQAGSWSVSEVVYQQINSPFVWGIFWSPLQIIFFILFQIAGMLLFEEHPFKSSFTHEEKEHTLVTSSWIRSARFYVWSALGGALYFGGDSIFGNPGSLLSFIGLQVKAFIIYLACRLVAFYFPKHAHTEVLRVGFLFLIPISFGALMLVLMFRGVFHG